MNYNLDHLRELESEAIYVLRETAAQFERPALLFSGGKDSIVITHLARKAFYPAKFPFPLVHIDTGHNFPEALAFRDNLVKELGATLIVGSRSRSIKSIYYEVKFAYAITCHKAQGGQWKNVFIEQGYLPEPTVDKEYLRWLYTAFTRAVDTVYLIGFKPDFFTDEEVYK